ncbi:MAG: protoporphyrinogen oxidase [Burkholderiales bacterium]|nr:protoporphyrinogen oxidase [Burkholderiales bacterium]
MSSGFHADVIVVGAGISGLASAWGMQQQGARVLVLEAGAQAGGCIATAREQGCLLESGPNSALATTPLIATLLDALGISGERMLANPLSRNRYIVRRGRLQALPLSLLAFLATPLFSVSAKLRLLREPFLPRGREDAEESVAGFVRRRLGDEFLDYAINPFVGGVYAGDPQALSVGAAFPRLHELEQVHGGLIRGQLLGAIARWRNPEKSKPSAPMFSFREGMQTLTDALVRHLEWVECAREVTCITKEDNHYVLEAVSAGVRSVYRARAVVLAVPAWAAAALMAPLAADAAAALAAIPYPPVAVVHSAYRHGAIAHPLDGFGMLVPQVENRQILGTIFSSSLFAGRAPQGWHLLTTFIGGARQPGLAQLDEADIAGIAQAEHMALLGAASCPEFARVRRWERAIPQYNIGHAARIGALEQAERAFPGIFFCANYRGGVAIGDCIKSADRCAAAVMALLGGG